jgi:hypothetical protein
MTRELSTETPSTCRLYEATGRVESCPGRTCAFWEEGALGGSCVFERIDLRDRSALAEVLLSVRTQLEEQRGLAHDHELWRRYEHLLNEGE